ncbi:peptidylprolyl isomerase [Azospirillum sp. RWY-5-1]|uniref:Parvulin-like PPIase n=1 Tax=Azospirillum oleiclasticum TaxID=2735135 RepID=A0ABX2T5X3_9PROT|nr:peptidylprolyl isomerase [Azospirillum oleiclasticum]NYZ12292.1 peptidylprolyl isomerase [Azospirillum oleiclasticum]NYZ19452.1 peptidylprolyl isomerase [Azospirillum oleiclasticum]
MPSLRAVRSLLAATTAVLVAGMVAQPAAAQQRAATQPAAARPAAGPGTQSERIAAVVNEDVVSMSDVYARIRLALLNAGLPDSQESRQRLVPQVMRQLVDERLQVQEAKRIGITVTDKEVDESVGRIAEQNGMNRQQLQKVLSDRGTPMSTLRDQLRSTLAWQKLLQRKIRQEVVIGDDEIDAALERMKENIGKPEYLVAEIFLSVDNPAQEDEVRRVAERLSDEIRRGGNFAAVARQFSQSAGAATGGDMGWIRQGELRPELDEALRKMRPGTLSPPVRTADGYHVLLVRSQRTVGSNAPPEMPRPQPAAAPRPEPRPDINRTKVQLAQMIFPVLEPTDAGRKAAKDRAEAARKSIRSCGDFIEKARASGIPEAGDMGMLNAKDLPKPLQQLVVNIPVGQPSPVLNSAAASILLIVCKRDMPMIEPPAPAAAPPPPPPPPPVQPAKTTLPTRDEIERELVNERAEMLSRRYLRDLRRSAFIEYRT